MLKNRGFGYGALAAAMLGVYSLRLGVCLWRLHLIRKVQLQTKDEVAFRNAVEGLIDEQVCLCFEDAGDEQIEDAFIASADELRALWGM
jgi:hypothetical protein